MLYFFKSGFLSEPNGHQQRCGVRLIKNMKIDLQLEDFIVRKIIELEKSPCNVGCLQNHEAVITICN